MVRGMKRIALALFLLLPTAAALAQSAGGALAPEPLSRAQVGQMIADHGYFELRHLQRGKDGSWRCTALANAGKRVTVILDKNGNISEAAAPEGGL